MAIVKLRIHYKSFEQNPPLCVNKVLGTHARLCVQSSSVAEKKEPRGAVITMANQVDNRFSKP